MTYGTSILLIAAGAVLRFAVTIHWHASTVNWHLIGDILMVIGVLGLVMSLIWLGTGRNRRIVEDIGAVPAPVERPPIA
jgi:hypothetical protein